MVSSIFYPVILPTVPQVVESFRQEPEDLSRRWCSLLTTTKKRDKN